MRSVLIVIFVFFYLLLGLPVLGAMWIIHKFAPAWADMAQLRLVQWAFRVIIFLSGADILLSSAILRYNGNKGSHCLEGF